MLLLGVFDGAAPETSLAPDTTPSAATDAQMRSVMDRTADDASAPSRPAAELRLHGVILTGADGEGFAMISAGQGSARTVALGAAVTAGMVLQSIASDRVAIGPPGGPAAVVLSIQPVPRTTQEAGMALGADVAAPAGMTADGETESNLQRNNGARSVTHPRRSRLHGIAVSR